ncbi:hypothetical protein B0H63DRAFT_228484 [Podospora didyma]|uniref:Uncharacterized protein n=1 Tax=Podospora didyma TaxID=330526 RepID=A0AAE0KKF4_9PEZI|nr:hypothetical protein B0H63DRAFT_228484 [Podospora didyma]
MSRQREEYRIPCHDTAFLDPAHPLELSLSCLDYLSPQHTLDVLLFLPIENERHNGSITKLLRTGLRQTLTRFRTLAGAIKTGPDGISTVVIDKSDYISLTVQQLQDDQDVPVYQDLQEADFPQHLISPSKLVPELEQHEKHKQSILAVQLNFFTHGLAIAVAWNRTITDFQAISGFLEDWARTCSWGWCTSLNGENPFSAATSLDTLAREPLRHRTSLPIDSSRSAEVEGALIQKGVILPTVNYPKCAAAAGTTTASSSSLAVRHVVWFFSEQMAEELRQEIGTEVMFGKAPTVEIALAALVAGGPSLTNLSVFAFTRRLANNELFLDDGIARAARLLVETRDLNPLSSSLSDNTTYPLLHDWVSSHADKPTLSVSRSNCCCCTNFGVAITSWDSTCPSSSPNAGFYEEIDFGFSRIDRIRCSRPFPIGRGGGMSGSALFYPRIRYGGARGYEVVTTLQSKHMGELLRDEKMRRWAVPRGTPPEKNPQDPPPSPRPSATSVSPVLLSSCSFCSLPFCFTCPERRGLRS